MRGIGDTQYFSGVVVVILRLHGHRAVRKNVDDDDSVFAIGRFPAQKSQIRMRFHVRLGGGGTHIINTFTNGHPVRFIVRIFGQKLVRTPTVDCTKYTTKITFQIGKKGFVPNGYFLFAFDAYPIVPVDHSSFAPFHRFLVAVVIAANQLFRYQVCVVIFGDTGGFVVKMHWG
jgi:hypothetical protein